MLARYPDHAETIRNAGRVVLIGDQQQEVFGRKPDVHIPVHIEGSGPSNQSMVLGKNITDYANDNATVFICSTVQARAVNSCLKQLGIHKCIDITHRSHRFTGIVDRKLLEQHTDEIEHLFNILEDDESKRILLSLLVFRITKNPSRIPSSPYPQYLHPLVTFRPDSVIVDGGAFVGDSALLFLSRTGEKAKIFSFEPQDDNYATMLRNIAHVGANDRVTPVKFGLWSSSGTLYFEAKGGSSHITENASTAIRVVSIDEFFKDRGKVDIIKLDIEGAETEALKGAEYTISTYRPLLILCVYHKGDHIWKIPNIIETQFGNYKYYLGHHSPDLTIYETVLYAIPQ